MADYDLALDAADRMRDRARYMQSERQWYVCSQGSRAGYWSPEKRSGTTQMIAESCIASTADSPSASQVSAVERLLRGQLAITRDDLDRDPFLLGLSDGALDLRTFRKRPVTPDDMLTLRCDTTIDVDEDDRVWPQSDRWASHLSVVTGADAGKAEFLQRAAGISLLGQVLEHGFVLLHGDGRNGKGVMIRSMAKALGDYAHAVPRSTLVSEDDRHPVDLMPFRGARMAYAEEMGRERLNTARLKTLTGGDLMQARGMRQDFETWRASHTLWVSLNELAHTGRDGSVGLWDRVWLVETGPTIPAAKRDPYWEEKIEPAGVLAWMVRGLQHYWWGPPRRGLEISPTMARDRDRWKLAEDDVARFAAGVAPGRYPTKDVYDRYRMWFLDEGLLGRPLSKIEFARRFVRASGAQGAQVRVGATVVRFLVVPDRVG